MAAKSQTIPACHGTATFVPKGHTIKITNTSGTQVFDTWAFALHAPPEKVFPKKLDAKKRQSQSSSEKPELKKRESQVAKKEEEKNATEATDSKPKASEKDSDDVKEEADSKKVDEQAPKKPESKKQAVNGKDTGSAVADASLPIPKPDETQTDTTEYEKFMNPGAGQPPAEGWSSYIPSFSSKTKTQQPTNKSPPPKLAKNQPAKPKSGDATDQEARQGWSSYIPSVRGSGGQTKKPAENASKDASKGWSAWIPSGQGYSSYLPSKSTVSAFAGSVSLLSIPNFL